MTVKTSTFTSSAIEIFARWQVHPSEAQKFTKVSFGTLTDSQAEDPNLYMNPDIEHMHAEDFGGSVEDVTNPDDIIITAEEGSPVAKVKVSVTFSNAMRGKVVREVGLYINVGPEEYILMWIGRFPDSYIPRVDETGVAVTLNVTVPIKFNNDAIPGYIVTDNTSLSFKIDQVSARVNTLNGAGEDEEKASKNAFDNLVTDVNSKASQDSVTALTSRVDNKADRSTVTELASLVYLKANKTYVDSQDNALQSQLHNKAEASAVNDLATFVEEMNGDLSTPRLKANQSDLNTSLTRISTLAQFVTTMNGNLSSPLLKANQTALAAGLEQISALEGRVNTLSGATSASGDKKKADDNVVMRYFYQTNDDLITSAFTGSSYRRVVLPVTNGNKTVVDNPDACRHFRSFSSGSVQGNRSIKLYEWPSFFSITSRPKMLTSLDFNFYFEQSSASADMPTKFDGVGRMVVYTNSVGNYQGFGSLSFALNNAFVSGWELTFVMTDVTTESSGSIISFTPTLYVVCHFPQAYFAEAGSACLALRQP